MSVSVIIPVYNAEKYLAKCLDSVCAQGACVQEIILINDGSTDGSLKICEQYAQKNKRIKLINQENHGLPATVRIGVNAATGKYIGFVDSDDYIEPDMFEVMYERLIEEDADLAFCDFDTVYENGERIAVNPDLPGNETVFIKKDGKFNLDVLPNFKTGNFISGVRWNKLLKKERITDNISFEDRDIKMGEDIALTIPIIFAAEKIVYIRKCFYHYVQQPNSMIHGYSERNIEDWKKKVVLLEEAAIKYEYKFENIKSNFLALFYCDCLHKIRISNLNAKTRKKELKILRQDSDVRKLLSECKLKAILKRKIVFILFKYKLYRLLSFIICIGV